MNFEPLDLDGLLIFEPRVFEDERGLFFESFNQGVFEEAVGRPVPFVQDNHSVSRKGVLRGLHYQLPPHGQGKLVRVVSGAVFDVAVDIRKSSPTFGKWTSVELSAENRKQLWIPEGFAHGFLALTENAQLFYKTTGFYNGLSEGSIIWADPEIGIDWPLVRDPILSTKDSAAKYLSNAELFS